MTIKDLKQAIQESSFSMYEEYINSLILPSIEIVKNNSEIKIASSKLGGIPDIPSDFECPQHKYGYYRFIAQFNLKDISQPFSHLPKEGLLSIFIADDEEGENFWGDDGYAKVYFFDDESILNPCTNQYFSNQPSISIDLKTSIDIPFRNELLKKNPLNISQLDELSYDIMEKLDKKLNYLLGYPLYSSLAYDPRPDEDWTSLLTLSSIEELNWCWHDGDFLMLFIEKEKLKQNDFSYIKSDAG
ncbi:YwqG family protein [Bernardetia sp. Wsw4-3y2]|uniref:YwqG family protein n=1 Tax=Bernardetia sp. Wsw4-3y2 TaxID=3127471 RepID=UPI0030D3117E